jgi:hypothetical protein
MLQLETPRADPFDQWSDPGEVRFLRPEACPKCPGRMLVGYRLDRDGNCHGSATKAASCGRPDRCGEKVHGVTPEEAFRWRSGA